MRERRERRMGIRALVKVRIDEGQRHDRKPSGEPERNQRLVLVDRTYVKSRVRRKKEDQQEMNQSIVFCRAQHKQRGSDNVGNRENGRTQRQSWIVSTEKIERDQDQQGGSDIGIGSVIPSEFRGLGVELGAAPYLRHVLSRHQVEIAPVADDRSAGQGCTAGRALTGRSH